MGRGAIIESAKELRPFFLEGQRQEERIQTSP